MEIHVKLTQALLLRVFISAAQQMSTPDNRNVARGFTLHLPLSGENLVFLFYEYKV